MTIGFSRVALLLPIALGFAPACGRNDKDMPTSSPRGAPGNQVAAVVQGADEDDDRPDTRKRKGWNDKAVNPFRQAEE
ncbi:MAG: hypothetical protein KC416_17585, partial [Myxococcales bacterium]|nr:hypothetical protein [Myxococcales bacterium]